MALNERPFAKRDFGGIIYTEEYRSGHNGLDSKSSNPLIGTVGSNPTSSAILHRQL